MKIAGLDIGTTGCKCTVFDEKGRYLDRAYCAYPVKRNDEGHEVDASAIMRSVYTVLTNAGEKHGGSDGIRGIGVTSFGETFVMTDSQGIPLNQAMIYTDPRGKDELKELVGKIGPDNAPEDERSRYIASITGLRPHEMYSISKIIWIKKHKPEVYRQTKHIFLMEDYVVFNLTGRAKIDYSLASRTMAFDIHTLNWNGEIFAAAGIDMGLMSEVVPSGTVAGYLKQEISKKTGLSPQTEIIAVSHDQVAAAAGAGVFDPETAVDGAGTVECITPVYDGIPDMDVM
jgi:xylulokinase